MEVPNLAPKVPKFGRPSPGRPEGSTEHRTPHLTRPLPQQP
jgi:hypothetical protein